MTEDLLARLALQEDLDVVLFYDPPGAEAAVTAWLGKDRVLQAQSEGDLEGACRRPFRGHSHVGMRA